MRKTMVGNFEILRERTFMFNLRTALVGLIFPSERWPFQELKVQSYPEMNLNWKLALGVAVIVLGTTLFLFSVNALYAMAYTILYRCSKETTGAHERNLWPALIGVCSKDHWQMMRMKAKSIAKPVPFFPALLTLMLGVFLATTAQFVITHYGLMIRTGNRDICFYNESCYYPGRIWDLPWNHIASNFAYFVAAVHIMLQAFFAETRCYFFSRRCIVALFKAMDAQQQGHLDRESWRRLFRKADRNHSGRVSRNEWKEPQPKEALGSHFDKSSTEIWRCSWRFDGQVSLDIWKEVFELFRGLENIEKN